MLFLTHRYTSLISVDTTLQKNAHAYPTLASVALDVCPIPVSSVPCERLFSGGGETATDRHTRLGTERFEQLQMLKHEWHDMIVDLAEVNSDVTDNVLMEDFCELFNVDKELAEWDLREDDIVDG
jgi:hAT family C-terminal dimerisation region